MARARALSLGLVLAALVCVSAAWGAEATAEDLFAKAVASLERGAFDDAIDRFEQLADRGFFHPDASFDRAAAYVERARTAAARPGDLGRAVAALEETLALRPNDVEAERALERVRGEIARRRARQGAEPVMTKTTLSRAIVGLLPEGVWAIIALVGSALSAVGLALNRLARSHRAELIGTTGAAIGGLLLLVFGGLAFAARHYRTSSRAAVVVAADARLLDVQGRPIVQKNGLPEHVSAPEGTSLFVLERSGDLSRVEWGPTVAWVQSSQLRVISADAAW